MKLAAGDLVDLSSARIRSGRVAAFSGRAYLWTSGPGDVLGGLDEPVRLQALTPAELDADVSVPAQVHARQAASIRNRRDRMTRGLTDQLLRPGACLPAGPYHSRGVRMDLFVVEQDRRVALPHHLLPVPGLGRRALIVTAHFPNFGTTALGGQPFEYAEIACFVPCIHPFRGGALYCPELRPDNIMAAMNGRELHGFPKRLASAVDTSEDALTFVLGDSARLSGTWSPRPVDAAAFSDGLVDALLGAGHVADGLGDVSGWLVQRLGLRPFLAWMPTLPILVRRRSPDACGQPALDELRGVPFAFSRGRADVPGLPAFREPRAFHQLDDVELTWSGPSWYRGRVLGGWRVTLDLELGEARALGPRGWLAARRETLSQAPAAPPVWPRPAGPVRDDPLGDLRRLAASDRALFEPGPDSRLVGGDLLGAEHIDLFVLEGPPTALDHVPAPLERLGDLRVLIVEHASRDAGQHGAGLYLPVRHPTEGPMLYAVERWMAHPGPLSAARERLRHPARWGGLVDGVICDDDAELFALDHDLLGTLDVADPLDLMGVPMVGNALPVVSWWRETGFRSGPPQDRLVRADLVVQGARAGLGPGALHGRAPGLPDQRIQRGVRFEGTSSWRPGGVLPESGVRFPRVGPPPLGI